MYSITSMQHSRCTSLSEMRVGTVSGILSTELLQRQSVSDFNILQLEQGKKKIPLTFGGELFSFKIEKCIT